MMIGRILLTTVQEWQCLYFAF